MLFKSSCSCVANRMQIQLKAFFSKLQTHPNLHSPFWVVRGYKLGCVCSYMAGVHSHPCNDWRSRNKHTQNCTLSLGMTLLKRGCANSGGFGARWILVGICNNVCNHKKCKLRKTKVGNCNPENPWLKTQLQTCQTYHWRRNHYLFNSKQNNFGNVIFTYSKLWPERKVCVT